MLVLILESVSGIHRRIEPRLFPEGFAMLRTMAREFSESGFEVITTLNEKFRELAGWIDTDVLFVRDGLKETIRSRPDAVLVIAPEKNGELGRITSEFRRKGVRLLGAGEDAIRVSGDKWLTYLALKGKVPQPRTWRTEPTVRKRTLIKPVDGVGCEGVGFSFPSDTRGAIFQEFIEGEHASCCLVMNGGDGTVLSVNKQEIRVRDGRFSYLGSEVPLEHESADQFAEIAIRAARALNLEGFCGVDLVGGEVPYFIELNPRVTTSFIALAEVMKNILGRILIDTLNGEPIQKPKLEGNSVVRIPRVKKGVKISKRRAAELLEISGVVAPPFAHDGKLKMGSPIFVVVGSGSSVEGAKSELRKTVEEAAALLEVELDDIAWA